jgi:hypothetical protein
MIDDNGESRQAGSAPISDHNLKSGSNANRFVYISLWLLMISSTVNTGKSLFFPNSRYSLKENRGRCLTVSRRERPYLPSESSSEEDEVKITLNPRKSKIFFS